MSLAERGGEGTKDDEEGKSNNERGGKICVNSNRERGNMRNVRRESVRRDADTSHYKRYLFHFIHLNSITCIEVGSLLPSTDSSSSSEMKKKRGKAQRFVSVNRG